MAQTSTTISPKGAAAAGTTDNGIPYSAWPNRYQQLYDYDSFTHGLVPFIVKAVHYRMNSKYANGTRGGQTIELTMWMATAPRGTTSTRFSMTFDNNVDTSSKKRVISRRKVKLPVLSNTNFDVKFPFDTATTFTMMPATQRTLVVEVVLWGNSVGNVFFGYPLDAARGTAAKGTSRVHAYDTVPAGGRYRQQGAYVGCVNRNRLTVMQYASAAKIHVGGTGGYTYANGYIQNIPAIGVLGSRPLAVTLPGTTCKLMQDLALMFPGVGTGPSGRHQVNFTIPNQAKLGGVKFLYQTIFVDPQANALGLVSTRGIEVTIGTAKATPPDQYKEATGSSTTYGLVTQFLR